MRLLTKLKRTLRNFLDGEGAYASEYTQRKRTQLDGRFYQQYAGRAEDPLGAVQSKIKPIAFYLPQMHPIPENDAWWGKGFTEWTNVSKAIPRFSGHYQPRLPDELGYYDLRAIETMERQVEIAKTYGLHAFCFYYYWFNGKRLLERPLDMFSQNSHLDLGFCICWANENWTRRWDGLNSDILIEQKYSDDDAEAIFDDWLQYFRGDRYLKVENKPVLLIYRPDLIPDFAKKSARWQEKAREHGFPGLYILGASAFNNVCSDARGLDGYYDFPPHNVSAPVFKGDVRWLDTDATTKIYDYAGAVEGMEARYADQVSSDLVTHPGVLVGWDTEARKPGRGDVFVNGSPALFRRWVKAAFERATRVGNDATRFVFINAWNEWAEGAYLEPDRRHGFAYLTALRSVVREFGTDRPPLQDLCANHNRLAAPRTSDKVIMLHLFYADLIDEFASTLDEIRQAENLDLVITVPELWSVEQVKSALRTLKPRKAFVVDNCGRDVYPFLLAGRMLGDDGYLYGCKIHSKKSTHRIDGARWRRELINNLLSVSTIADLKTGFFDRQGIGIAAPSSSFLSLGVSAYVAGNRESLEILSNEFDLSEVMGRGEFIAGTMFWFAFDLFAPIFNSRFEKSDFGDDLGQVDGTLAHGFERIFAAYAVKMRRKVYKIRTRPTSQANKSP